MPNKDSRAECPQCSRECGLCDLHANTGPEKDAGEIALDEIAALCGVAEWDYPGQVVRDVKAVIAQRDTAESQIAAVQHALGGIDLSLLCDEIESRTPRGERAAKQLAALREAAAKAANDWTAGETDDHGLVAAIRRIAEGKTP
jgi:hypothetical protein